jgi:hypothetical protein
MCLLKNWDMFLSGALLKRTALCRSHRPDLTMQRPGDHERGLKSVPCAACEDELLTWTPRLSCRKSFSTASSATVEFSSRFCVRSFRSKFPAGTSSSPSYCTRLLAKSRPFPVSMKLFVSHRSPRSMIMPRKQG